MARLKFIVSLLVLFCYLCPFESCGFQETAVEVVANNHSGEKTAATKSIQPDSTSDSYLGKLYEKIIFPTDNSISGIGLVLLLYSKTLIGCFILSLLTIIPIKFLRRANRLLLLLILNLMAVCIYIITTLFIDHSTLLWGCWLMSALLLARTLLEISYRTNPTSIQKLPQA